MGTVTELPNEQREEESSDERLERQMAEQRERLASGATGTEFGEPWKDAAGGAPAQEDDGDGSEELSLVLEGSQAQLSFDVGGKAPTTSHLTLTGGQIELAAGYEKGEKIILVIEATVEEIAFRDEVDPKTRQVVGCKRKHRAKITGVRPQGSEV